MKNITTATLKGMKDQGKEVKRVAPGETEGTTIYTVDGVEVTVKDDQATSDMMEKYGYKAAEVASYLYDNLYQTATGEKANTLDFVSKLPGNIGFIWTVETPEKYQGTEEQWDADEKYKGYIMDALLKDIDQDDVSDLYDQISEEVNY